MTEQRSLVDSGYQSLLGRISEAYTAGRMRALQAINTHITETYWQVGRHLVEFEQAGDLRAEYGKALINTLAADLGLRHGKGFSRSNLVYMRLLYLRYPISQKPSHQLSWSHYVELLKLDDALERGFYEKQAIAERWSVPELKRQKAASLFLRLAASKDKAGILQLAAQGQIIAQPADLGYFAHEENGEGDNPPIGIILSRHKDELLVEYATYGMNSQLFVQQYQLYLPDREALRRELERSLREVER